MVRSRHDRSPSPGANLSHVILRRPSFSTPPVRCSTSPPITEEQAAEMVSPYLPYRTRYTYAFSKLYNPDLEDHWEVPNLANTSPYVLDMYNTKVSSSSWFSRVIKQSWLILLFLFYTVKTAVTTVLSTSLMFIYDFLHLMFSYSVGIVTKIYSRVCSWISLNKHSGRSVNFVAERTHDVYEDVFSQPHYQAHASADPDSRYHLSASFITPLRHSSSSRVTRRSTFGRNKDYVSSKYTEKRSMKYLGHTDDESTGDETDKAAVEAGFVTPVRKERRSYIFEGKRVTRSASRQLAQANEEQDIPANEGLAVKLGRYSATVVSILYFILMNILVGTLSLMAFCSAPFLAVANYFEQIFSSSSSVFSKSTFLQEGSSALHNVYLSAYSLATAAFNGCRNISVLIGKSVFRMLYGCFQFAVASVFACLDFTHWAGKRFLSIFSSTQKKPSTSSRISRRACHLWFLLLPLLLLLGFAIFARDRNSRILKDDFSNDATNNMGNLHALHAIVDDYYDYGKTATFSLTGKISNSVMSGLLWIWEGLSSMTNFFGGTVHSIYESFIMFLIRTSESGSFTATYAHSALAAIRDYAIWGYEGLVRFFFWFGSWISTTADSLESALDYYYNTLWGFLASFVRGLAHVIYNFLLSIYSYGKYVFVVVADSVNAICAGVSRWYYSHKVSELPLPSQAVPPPAPSIIIASEQQVASACTSMDEEKLVKQISEKLRMEFAQEIRDIREEILTKIVLEAAQKIELDLKDAQSTSASNIVANPTIDTSLIAGLVQDALMKYDKDKTGLFDYALESAGASVITTRCSENYARFSRLESIFNIPLYWSTYGPRTVIQRNAVQLFPGECWAFANGKGYIAIELSHHINVTSISYEHIGPDQAPDGNRQSAPKDVVFWAYDSRALEKKHLLGHYSYDLDGPALQFFPVKEPALFPVKAVELEVTSNHGKDFTCLYRLRVHGMPVPSA